MDTQRPSMTAILKGGTDKCSNSKLQRVMNSLKWRTQTVNQEEYVVKFYCDGGIIPMKQVGNGEMKGLGTGRQCVVPRSNECLFCYYFQWF